MSPVSSQASFLKYAPEDFNDLDSNQYEAFYGHPENVQKWLDVHGGIELRDADGELILAETLSTYELDDFRQALIDNGYLEDEYDVDSGGSRLASSPDPSRWTAHIAPAAAPISMESNWLEKAQLAIKPLPSIPFASPEGALDHLKSIFVDNYYPKTLGVLRNMLTPVTYTDLSDVSSTVPSFVRELFAAFLKGSLRGAQQVHIELEKVLKHLGLRGAEIASLSRALAGTFYQALCQSFQVKAGERLEDKPVYKRLLTSLISVEESGNARIFQVVDKLLAMNAAQLGKMFPTEHGLKSVATEWAGPEGMHLAPLANVRMAIAAQEKNVRASTERIAAMREPADIAHILKSFEGDVRDVHWIYEQLGIPKNHDGQYLVDSIYERLKTMNVNLLDMTPLLAPLARDFNVDEKTWSLCLQIAREKKKIAFQETAFMVVAVGASIAAVVGGAAVAGPVGGMVAGGVVSAAIGGGDVYRTLRPVSDVGAANTAHRLVDFPIGDDEHVEIVEAARDYAVTAAVANTLLAITGGAINPALGSFAKAVIPGKTLMQVSLRALLNTSLQGSYGAVDGALSASFDGRQTNQEYLDTRHEMSGAQGEAPKAMTALVFSAALGGTFGVGAEFVFGSGKFEILCALDGALPTIVDAVTGRILKGFRISTDGKRIIAPDGTEAPLIVRDEPRVVVKDGDEEPMDIDESDLTPMDNAVDDALPASKPRHNLAEDEDVPVLKDEDVVPVDEADTREVTEGETRSVNANAPAKIPTRAEFSEAFPHKTGADGYPVTYVNLDPDNPNDQWRVTGYDESSGMATVEKTHVKMLSLDPETGSAEVEGFSGIMKTQDFKPGQKITDDDGVAWTVVTVRAEGSDRMVLSRSEQLKIEAAQMLTHPDTYSPDIILRPPGEKDRGFFGNMRALYDFIVAGRLQQAVITKVGAENVTITPRHSGEAVETTFPCSQITQREGFANDVDFDALEAGQWIKDVNGNEWQVFAKSGDKITLVNRDGVYTTPELRVQAQMANVYDVTVRLPSGETHTIEVVIPDQGDAAKNAAWVKMVNDMVAQFPADFVTTCERIVVNPRNYRKDAAVAATATAGDTNEGIRPTIDFYPEGLVQNGEVILETAWHEMGHLIVARYFNVDFMPPDSWMDAMVRDRAFVSAYAQKEAEEDFAETVMKYIATDGGVTDPALRQRFAERFKLLDDVFDANPHEKIWMTNQIMKIIGNAVFGTLYTGGAVAIVVGGDKVYRWVVTDDHGRQAEVAVTLSSD